ncbi:MAG: GTPase Era, partial [Alphaproteobacteria bacterium]|nr:GTPase Era [Alphaproteobacteria bacterium]
MSNIKKCGFVAVVGETNAGKSTLINGLVGQRVSIVSRKVQTTRFNIRGILTTDKAQLVFVDTPGIFAPKNVRDKLMVRQAFDSLSDTDAVLVVVDASKKLSKPTERLFKSLQESSVPLFLALNKVDKVHPKEKLFEIAQDLSAKATFQNVFMIDSLHEKGTETLVEEITKYLPESPLFYDEKTKTDLPLALTISEMIREQVYGFIHEEIPYGITVKTESITETDKTEIQAVIYVAREGYKKIVLGEKGSKIKIIGQN